MPGHSAEDGEAAVRPPFLDPCRGGGGRGIGEPPEQVPLPTFRHTLRRDDGRFAHPAEREFARLLSFYRVAWAYEPTAFAIEWRADGCPCGYFTPDFYLPRQGLYIELTTMRQPLVTRKNRKLRRLRELYPNVRVKVLYKRDVQRLRLTCRPGEIDRGDEEVGETLFCGHEIRGRLAQLGERIADEWLGCNPGGDRPVLLGVGSGSGRTLAELDAAFRQQRLVVEPARLALTRYHGDATSTRIRLSGLPAGNLTGRRVLLIEDVVSSGLSVAAVTGWLERQGVAEWRVCTLLDRRVARLIDIPIAWSAFIAPDDLLVGFGLTLKRQFSRLPDIARLQQRPG